MEMYATPTCLTPMQYSCVLSHVTVHNLVSISHVLMLQCTWKYAILMCLFSNDSTISYVLSHVAVHVLVHNSHVFICVAVHVEVRHPSGPQRAAGAVLAELRSCGLQRGGVPSLGTGHGIPYHRCIFLQPLNEEKKT